MARDVHRTFDPPPAEPSRGKTLAAIRRRVAEASLLHYEQRQHASGHCAPIVHIDPDMPFLSSAVVGLMVWPNDPLRQAQSAATDGLRLLELLQMGPTDEVREAMVARLAGKMGMPHATLRGDPALQWYLEQFLSGLPKAMRRTVEKVMESLITPAGGLSAAAFAPAASVLNSEVLKAINGPARNAGMILLSVLKLGDCEGYAPSLNNACDLLAGAPPEEGGLGIEARHLKGEEIWERWRCIAHLWAAMIAELEFFSGRRFNAATFQIDLHDLLKDRVRVLRALRWAMRLREFAVTHRSDRAKLGSVLIPDPVAIDLRVAGLTAEAPVLTRPSDVALTFARKKRQPKTRGRRMI